MLLVFNNAATVKAAALRVLLFTSILCACATAKSLLAEVPGSGGSGRQQDAGNDSLRGRVHFEDPIQADSTTKLFTTNVEMDSLHLHTPQENQGGKDYARTGSFIPYSSLTQNANDDDDEVDGPAVAVVVIGTHRQVDLAADKEEERSDNGRDRRMLQVTTSKPTSRKPTLRPTTRKPSTTTKPTSIKPTTAKPTTSMPTTSPSFMPTSSTPSSSPTFQPTTLKPTTIPTPNPTHIPTSSKPTSNPTFQPTTRKPTGRPTFNPTSQPTSQPTPSPTSNPTLQPTSKPTPSPTSNPTLQPTRKPTPSPTSNPTLQPTTSKPTLNPTQKPTGQPTSNPTTRKPTSKPTSQPTFSPTPEPTLEPTFEPSTLSPTTFQPTTSEPTASSVPTYLVTSEQPSYGQTYFPSSAPSQIPLLFDGIENAESIFAGKFDLSWDFPSYEGEIPALENIYYHVFSAIGSYNFSSALESTTVLELIAAFEEDDDITTQHHQVEGDMLSFTVSTPYIDELHSILVIAEADGVFSRNTLATELYPSKSDPVVKENVNIVGVFVPSDLLSISLGSDNVLDFDGPVREEHLNLVVGDFVSGFTSDFQYFFLRIIEVVVSSDQRVILITEEGRLEDIFDSINYEASLAISRPGKVEFNPSSVRRRHLLAQNVRVQRRLWCHWAFFCDNVVKPIGDFANNVKKGFEDAWNFLTKGKLEESIEILKIHEEFSFELNPLAEPEDQTKEPTPAPVPGKPEKPKDPEFEITFGNVTGLVEVRVDLYIKLELNSRELMAETGIRAEYGADLTFNLGPKAKLTGERKLYERTIEKTFLVFGVPVQVGVTPAVHAKYEVGIDMSDASVQISVGAKGGAHLSVAAGTSRGITNSFKPPDLTPYFNYKASDGEISFEASVKLEPSFAVELYKGALKGKFRMPMGPELEMVFRPVDINGDRTLAIETFDVNIKATGNLEFGSNLVDKENPFKEFELFSKSWPVLSLPKPSFPPNARHYCDESSDGIRAAYIENVSIQKSDDDPAWIKSSFSTDATWFLADELANEWSLQQEGPFKAKLLKSNVPTSSTSASGRISVAIRPEWGIIKLPFPVIYSVELDSIVTDTTADCMRNGICSDSFFDGMAEEFSPVFNSEIFLAQAPDPADPPFPSTVYKFEDFMKALQQLKAKDSFHMWFGDGCGLDAKKRALVNIAAFLGQSMRETIIYDACDENNWDSWRADVFKEPTSPPEYLSAFYPMSSSCGQLGQSYEDYDCEDACPKDPGMEITGTTNADWIGAPPPLFCGPREKYDGLGYWNPMKFCGGPDKTCVDQPFYYPGQTAGYYTSIAEDPKYPNEYYANPLPDASGAIQQPRFDNLPRTNVEGCCWWGRGVIQTTGRCNFGKLNKNIGSAAQDSLYPDINFCTNPQAICTGPQELKWIAGIFFWVSEVETYQFGGLLEGYKNWVNQYVDQGCTENPDLEGCDRLFEFASGIVNRGCHNPGESGCPNCIPGATCGPAHKVPERVAASKQVLRAFMKSTQTGGTCGNGERGNGICPIEGDCCNGLGWCGNTPDHCGGGGGGSSGTCGNGQRGNGICPIEGECCSEYGWCGNTPDHCGGGGGGSSGTCGNGERGNGICPIQGDCCSKYGWCGNTPEHCSA